MKFETYKRMSREQKEFWDWHYRSLEFPGSDLILLCFLWLVIAVCLLMQFVISKEYLPNLKTNADFIGLAAKLTAAWIWMYLLVYVGSWAIYIAQKYKERKWLKSQGLR